MPRMVALIASIWVVDEDFQPKQDFTGKQQF
jgi:hypothetical protein